MADIEITVDGGSSARLLTAGKYCDRNILVKATGGGGGTVVPAYPKDVNFYDYEGTLLYSYTIAEANLLTELPQPPTHDGLTFQGWNYSLESVKTATRRMDVGATYITSDGKTRLYISVPANSEPGLPPPRNQVPLYFRQTVANGVTIDWGDGSEPETLPGTGVVNTTHTYETAGDFVITLNPADGCELNLGSGDSANGVMGSTGNGGIVYCNMLRRVNIGRGVTSIASSAFSRCCSLSSITIPSSVAIIGDNAFYTCYSLDSVVIPNRVTSVGKTAFRYCYALSLVAFPSSATSIGDNAFQNCYSISDVTIPNGVDAIGRYMFANCYSLSSITIPSSVTSIEYEAFSNCYGVKEFHFKSESPPVLQYPDVLSGIPSDCIIYVPVGSLNAYKSGANWASYVNYMQEEPA